MLRTVKYMKKYSAIEIINKRYGEALTRYNSNIFHVPENKTPFISFKSDILRISLFFLIHGESGIDGLIRAWRRVTEISLAEYGNWRSLFLFYAYYNRNSTENRLEYVPIWDLLRQFIVYQLEQKTR